MPCLPACLLLGGKLFVYVTGSANIEEIEAVSNECVHVLVVPGAGGVQRRLLACIATLGCLGS